MKELNPNHPVTRELHDNWHKFAAILMHKFRLRRIAISVEDIDRMNRDWPDGINIVAEPEGKIIHLTLVDNTEAERLAREEGGLPV